METDFHKGEVSKISDRQNVPDRVTGHAKCMAVLKTKKLQLTSTRYIRNLTGDADVAESDRTPAVPPVPSSKVEKKSPLLTQPSLPSLEHMVKPPSVAYGDLGALSEWEESVVRALWQACEAKIQRMETLWSED
ncbi:hypothetical protein WOLCODRAFT_20748 [Wolfiporia cocos MD-104 SS10]|uniref:Uncharacterized protein n=1 Tax=Wolfiporia cocos (strain MD-104) TaxID=742152 RepID=A0A2H3J3P0_WOLCO|nr:hypothetical protein WOLCODRAFT_20748 [Wolfiporia cocos MD-104 SS10]